MELQGLQHEPPEPVRSEKIGRNQPCLCGSGKNTKNVVRMINEYLPEN